jgi:predicted RNase H-like HicB family nuclease
MRALLPGDGDVRISGVNVRHLLQNGRVTVPHPNRDLPIGTLKAMRQYIALIHKDPGSDYGVSFPDIPGCVTVGVDLDDARGMAEEALALHLAGMAEDEEPIPEPSSLEAVMADRENRDAVAILVKAPPAAAKAVRVN